jgi:hypothetical protein
MGKRFGIAGFQNTGKSFSRRWIPDGHNCMIIQPSVKASWLFTGPKDAHKLTPEQLDEAVHKGTRKLLDDRFDVKDPHSKFESLKQAASLLPNAGPHTNEFDALESLVKFKAPGYFKREHVTGNIILAPEFPDMAIASQFVDKLMPWVHTLILPDFTHFITEKITSDEFRGRKFKDEAFARYIDLAAEGYRAFIKGSDHFRKDLIVVTEYHVEWVESRERYELFLPGGQQMKQKFLPASYYDVLLFTDVVHGEEEEDKPLYQFVTRATKRYPEARSGGLFEDLRIENNIQEALTAFRKQQNIPLRYE